MSRRLGGEFHEFETSDDVVCDPTPLSCLGDIDANGEVNIEDLLDVISSWGPCE